MTTSRDLFHNFFHGGKDHLSGANVHFEDNVFFSYATTIALKATDDNGDEWLLISSNSMSSTTAKHLCALRQACPHDRILPIPLSFGDRVFDLRDVACIYAGYARDMADSTFSKRDARLDFIRVHDGFVKFLDLFKSQLEGSRDYLDRATETLAGLREKCDAIEERLKTAQEKAASRTPEEIEAMREKRRLAEERRRKRIDEKTAAIMSMPYLKRVRLLYGIRAIDERPYDIPKASWALAQQKMRDSGEARAYSFMWPEGEGVRTSQRVYVPSEDVKKAILLHVRTRHVLGAKIGGFPLVDINDKAVRVGCHLIPMENVKAMAEYYGIEWK